MFSICVISSCILNCFSLALVNDSSVLVALDEPSLAFANLFSKSAISSVTSFNSLTFVALFSIKIVLVVFNHFSVKLLALVVNFQNNGVLFDNFHKALTLLILLTFVITHHPKSEPANHNASSELYKTRFHTFVNHQS